MKIVETRAEACPTKVGRRPPDQSVGAVLAADIKADMDLPPFDRSQMDGFAVISADLDHTPTILRIVGESAAGRGWHKSIRRGETVRIMTGAAVPAGADAVIKVELTSEARSFKTINSNDTVQIFEGVKTRTAIVRRAEEIRKDTVVFRAGDLITKGMVAPLAAFGHARVRVAASPRVAILGTGSEIVEIGKRPGRDQIRNSNSAMLAAMCRSCNAEPEIFPIARDDVAELKRAITSAVRGREMLIITGGVSVGKYDHTGTALAELGAEIFFERVRLKPGKPTVFAQLGKTLVFGLPGNPVSASVTFYLFVRTALLKMQGARDARLEQGSAILTAPVRATKERDTYLPSRVAGDRQGRLVATPLNWQGSSDLIGFARADAFVVLKKGERLEVGDTAVIAWI